MELNGQAERESDPMRLLFFQRICNNSETEMSCVHRARAPSAVVGGGELSS